MKILVTGATGGIGQSLCKELSEIGEVYGTGRNETILKSLNINGYCVCDLTKNISDLINYIKENKFDVIVNNAGEYIYGSIDAMTDEQTEHIIETNLTAPVKIITSAVENMKINKFGRIINIGSISGVMGEANASLYSATKAGLIGLTKALALELAEYNITVNTINPGWVETTLGKNSIDESEFTQEEIMDIIPQKRFIHPDEISKLTTYLISNDAKGITGQSINLCAGLSVGI